MEPLKLSRANYVKHLEKELAAANAVINELTKELFELKTMKRLALSNPVLHTKIINLD